MRETLSNAALRVFNSAVRTVIMAVDDSKLMQTIDARGINGEYFTGVERPQNYGFNSVPVKPDDNGGKAAEAVIGFRDGNRAHPYVVSEGDRRSRPRNWQPGESGLYDDQKQQVYLSRSGIKISGGTAKLPLTVTVGNTTLTIADGKATVKVGSDDTGPAIVVKADMVFLGEDPDKGGTFDFVSTSSGPSVNVKAKIG